MKQPLALFPGMAAVTPGSGARLLGIPSARRVLDEFAVESGVDVAWLLSNAGDDRLFADRSWELAAVAAEVAATAAYRESGGAVGATLGFSIGAYAALAAAGAVTIGQIVRMIDLVLEASRRLIGPFRMAAVVGLSADDVRSRCRGGEVEHAACITASQHLVAGRADAVEGFVAAARSVALRVVELDVRWPLHTSLMEPVAVSLAGCRDEIGGLAEPSVPVYSAYHGRAVTDRVEAFDLLVGHLWKPQRFAEALTRAVQDGFGRLVELGPGATLSRVARWVVPEAVEVIPLPFLSQTPGGSRVAC